MKILRRADWWKLTDIPEKLNAPIFRDGHFCEITLPIVPQSCHLRIVNDGSEEMW